MRSLSRTLICFAVFGLAFFGVRVGSLTPDGATSAEPMVVGFGATVVVGDGEIFVGEAANQFRPGIVYVYRKGATGWQEAAQIKGPTAAVGDQFGSALALDGSRLFVGAGAGNVHVFMKQGTTWSRAGTIPATAVPAPSAPAPATQAPATPVSTTGTEAAPSVRFGSALAASGEWLLIGKEVVIAGGRGRGGFGGGGGAGRGANEPPAPLPPGAVFAFKRDTSGQYAYNSTLVSADAANAGDGFGSALALAGTAALIGANGQANRAGVVHEFGLDAADGTWKSQRTFAPLGIQAGEFFGAALALTGDQAIVSAPGDAGGYGAVYVFRKIEQAGRRGGGAGAAAAPGQAGRAAGAPGGGQSLAVASGGGGNLIWQEVARLAAPAGLRGDRFATSVAADDKEVWIGAPGAGGPGRVFVFAGNATGFKIDGLQLLGPGRDEPAATGQSISLRGNIAAVGATGVNRNAGGLFIYERDGTGAWHEQPLITTALDELPALTGSERRCSGSGKVEMFECGAADLLAFLPPSKLTHDGHYIMMSGIWGWTDSRTRQEWALLGRRDGATFVDITNPTRPLVVADVPLTEGARPSTWREIKVYKDHAFIVSDGAGPHGMQIFDLTRLRTMKPQPNGLPQKVEPDVIYRNINSAHNIVINEESGFGYPVGSSGGGTTCGGGLHMIDIREPKNPKFVGCFADAGSGRAGTGYSHDAVCVTYKGPDKRYKGHEICIGSNETAISIADVTDKTSPKLLSRSAYPNVGYTHQGWFTEDHRYFFVNDETDEGRNGINKTRTLIWDLVDLENPKFAKEHMGVEAASDHNLYIKGHLMYQANYRSGLRVLSVRDPLNPKEIAYFDTAPYGTNGPGFNGAWTAFPFFKSGAIAISSIEQGLFIVRTADK